MFGRVSVNWKQGPQLEQKSDKADDDDGNKNGGNVAETVAWHQNPDADCAWGIRNSPCARKLMIPVNPEDQGDADPHQDDYASQPKGCSLELLDKRHHDTSLLGQLRPFSLSAR